MVILPAWRRTLTVLMLVAALLATRAGRAAEARVAVPGEAAQAAARKTINEVFGKQWEAARTAAARQALAASLLEQAGKLADDPAGQFVLLGSSRYSCPGSPADARRERLLIAAPGLRRTEFNFGRATSYHLVGSIIGQN